MRGKVYLKLLLVLSACVVCCCTLSFDELNDIFEDSDCIEGNFEIENEVNADNPQLTANVNLIPHKQTKMQLSEKSKQTSDYLVQVQENAEDAKNVLNLINELSQRHNIDVEYTLISEEGLPHERTFHVRLILGEESFVGVGRTIKEAKRAAGWAAWSNTQYAKAERKSKAEIQRNVETLSSTVHLNNIAAKLGMRVEYFNEPANILHENSDKYLYYSLDSSSTHGSYLKAMNKSFEEMTLRSQNLETRKRGGPYQVRVEVGDDSFIGVGWSEKTARHAAAERALELFKKMSLKDAEECLERGELCNKLNTKSPISVVHELGTKHQMQVSFDVVAENGPPHKRVFVTRCKVGDLSADGEASTKKKSKKLAAEAMMKLIDDVKPWDAINVLGDNATQNKKKNKKVKRLNTLESAAMSVMDSLGLSGIKHETVSVEKGPKGELLELGKEIGIHIQFSSYHDEEGQQFGSLVSVHTKPAYHCYGRDVSALGAEDNAAVKVLKFIKDVGLNHIMVPMKKMQQPEIVLVETAKRKDADMDAAAAQKY